MLTNSPVLCLLKAFIWSGWLLTYFSPSYKAQDTGKQLNKMAHEAVSIQTTHKTDLKLMQLSVSSGKNLGGKMSTQIGNTSL
jgi:hypothetical protein